MAIVKMKGLRLLAMRSDQTALLRRLRKLGCVEIREPRAEGEDGALLVRPDGQALGALVEQRSDLEGALAVLKREAPVKEGLFKVRPVVEEARFFDDGAYRSALQAARAINGAMGEVNAALGRIGKLETRRAALAPWLDLPVALDTKRVGEVAVLFGGIPRRMERLAFTDGLSALTDLCEVTWAGEDRELQYAMVLVHRSALEEVQSALPELGFTRVNWKDASGTAAQEDRALREELDRARAGLEESRAALLALADRRGDLRLALDRASQEIALEENRRKLLDTQAAFYLEGWFPAEREEALGKVLGEYGAAWESWEPAEEEYPQVPVALKNGWFSRPLNMVTDMYALPAYGTLDPNPLMAPFFILFYGMMMADMGYGLLMVLAGLLVIRKTRPKGPTVRYMFPLLVLCGVSTFIWGAVTGSFFGDFIPQLLKLIDPESTFALPALFSPVDDALAVLVGSLVLGVVQIFTGMGISMYKKCKRRQVMDALCDEGAWFLVFLCVALAFLTPLTVPFAVAAAVVLVLTQGHGKKGILGKLVGIGGSLYNHITGYFSDILSYSRLMALMLAGAVIAQVFNTLGAITGFLPTFVVIAFVGNGLNFALNLLGCYVHDMRLQCLEFFSRFYEDGGKPFKPLDITTQYVDVINK